MTTARNLLTSAENYLANSSSVRVAHLVRLDVPTVDLEGAPTITPFYLTDYLGNIVYDGKTYQAGKVTRVGDIRQTQGLSNYKLSIEVAGEFPEELARGLVENLDFSYIGKEIEVLRAYLDTSGAIIPFDATSNGPMQYFIGDIFDVNISEGVVSGTSKVTWQCAGKLADFDKVNGRITDDASHRGLVTDEFGNKVPSDGAKVPSHQTDTGFQHAAQTINLVTSYTTTEKRYKLKKRHFWQSSKLVEYDAEVERTLELGIDLAAQFLPKIYGVRKVPGIPVFIDALKSSPNTVYVVYAFSEGEVDGFLDLYIDGEPLICGSSADKISTICMGNQANGDTISAFMSTDAQAEYLQMMIEQIRNEMAENEEGPKGAPVYIPTIPPLEGTVRTEGTKHIKDPGTGVETLNHFTVMNSTGNKEVWVHHGLPNQNANQELVDIAASNNFLNQDKWVAAEPGRIPSQYWDQNCKLLDTAYIVIKFGINEEETSIPEIEAVISGSLVSTYDISGVETPKQYTLNPVWHLLDYMTNPMYGGGLDVSDNIDLKSFYEVAAQLDEVTNSYQNNFLTYWRYVGWKVPPSDPSAGAQRTVMQCNTLLNTESTVTKNAQGLLDQFDGTLNILGGKYHLSIENDAAAIAAITIDEVIGNISTADLSNKNKWNSIQAAIVDPALGWNTNQINFFNSSFLAKDNGVQKKGNLGFAHVTNYYTAREWAERQLKKSRFSRRITITTYHKYLYLYPNANITFYYARFWEGPKKFRVVEMSIHSDSRVSLTLEDYDSTIYSPSESSDNSGENESNTLFVGAPTLLAYVKLPNASYSIASTEDIQGILVWDGPATAESIERFDVIKMTGTNIEHSYTVATDQIILEDSDPSKPRYYFAISGLLANTDYIYKVRTVSTTGKGSKYVSVGITTTVSPTPVKLSPPTNFIVLNSTSANTFSGPDLQLSWVSPLSPSMTGYQLEITNQNGVNLRTVHLSTVQSYTYTLALNKYDFNLLNGSVGAYRTLSARIRTTNGSNPSDPLFSSSDWVYL